MSEPELLIDVHDEVLVLTLNRPKKYNALSTSLRDAIRKGWRDFERDPKLRVAILTAAGSKAFCAGRDLAEAADGRGHGFLPFPKDEGVTKPIIAAVNGICMGGGFFVAMDCDLLVAAENATFALSEGKVGRGPAYGFWMNGMVPQKIALEMLLTGKSITAQRGAEIGLVNHVTPPEKLLDTALELAREICASAPLSVRATKEMMYATVGMERDAALSRALEIFEPVFASTDAIEGLNAFREKRKPVWKAR